MLTDINIPDSVTEIGRFAFCGCEELRHIHIPASIERIGYFAFDSTLGQLNIPAGVQEDSSLYYETMW